MRAFPEFLQKKKELSGTGEAHKFLRVFSGATGVSPVPPAGTVRLSTQVPLGTRNAVRRSPFNAPISPWDQIPTTHDSPRLTAPHSRPYPSDIEIEFHFQLENGYFLNAPGIHHYSPEGVEAALIVVHLGLSCQDRPNDLRKSVYAALGAMLLPDRSQ